MGSKNISEWNTQVRRLADSRPDSAETKFGFSCQCVAAARLLPSHFEDDACSAWADGHKRDATSDVEAAGLLEDPRSGRPRRDA